MLIQGVEPGPLMLVKHPDVFWGVIASMYVGNAMLLVLNLPLVDLWVLMIAIVGSYSLRNNFADVYLLVISGGVGYLFGKASLDAAPLVMAFTWPTSSTPRCVSRC